MKENIFQIKRDQVLQYHKENYFGGNFNLMAVGNIDHKILVEYSEKYFGKAPAESPINPKSSSWKFGKKDSQSEKIYKKENENITTILSNHRICEIDSFIPGSRKFIEGETKPTFQPNIMLIEGENQKSTKIGIYYDAPDWYDPEMYIFLLLQRMIGTY